MVVKARNIALLLGLSTLTAGCLGTQRENRYGPGPLLFAEDARTSAERQTAIMMQLAVRADVLYPVPPGSREWYLVALAGFNYVDEKCDLYLHDLFILDRRKDRTVGVVNAVGSAANAVLAATDASKLAIALAAQAFGLATGVTNVVATSYLFKVAPTVIFGTVEKMRVAYQAKTLEKFASEPTLSQVASEPAVYALVRGYLELCMPENIESKITAVVSAAGTSTEGPNAKERTTPPPALESPKISVDLVAQ